ncbi:MAG: AAA family ATPase [Pseudomonadota bacterium]
MSGNLAVLPQPEPLRAVSVSRDVQEFDLLIEDMEAELGEGWGDLDFVEATAFLQQDDAKTLEFIVVAVDKQDEDRLSLIKTVISQAKRAGLKVVLVAEGLGPIALHELLRAGADDFAPYPLPEKALADAVARIRAPGMPDNEDMMRRAGADTVDGETVDPTAAAGLPMTVTGGGKTGSKDAGLFAFQSAAGGDGATTLAVNLAWELATIDRAAAPKVLLIDLGLQFGSVATYLDLPRKATIYDLLTDVSAMDEQAFLQALSPYKDKLSVFTAPSDILPLDLIGPEEVTALLKLARSAFDIVIVDMPGTLTSWTDTVITESDMFYLVCELEVRSAQNALRFQKLLQAEGIPSTGLSYILNRAPGKMDMTGRSRIDKMADSLDIKFHTVLPDGGRQVTDTNDQAQMLRDGMPKAPLTKEIAKFAAEIEDARTRIEAGEVAQPAKKKTFFGLSFG